MSVSEPTEASATRVVPVAVVTVVVVLLAASFLLGRASGRGSSVNQRDTFSATVSAYDADSICVTPGDRQR